MKREMKDSGVAWIGEIPEHWEIVQVKKYCKNIYAGGTPDSNNMDYWEEGNIPWLPSGMCRDSEIYEANKFITQLGFENSSTKIIPAYTTIMAMTGATCGNMGFVTFETCANQSVVAYVSENNSFPKYLFYALLSAREYILTFQTGGAQAGINVQNCKNFIIPFIDIEEQQKIAEFLDRKCGEIDEMISLQEKVIEELKAYKQSIITEAVTKGLNPNVAMKDSGIEWIGEIPEHWEQGRLKNYFHLHGRIGWNGLRSEEFKESSYAYLVTGQDFIAKDIDWQRCYQIDKERFDEDEYIQLENGDILVTKDGTIGKVAIVSNLDKPACLNSGIFVIKQYEQKRYNTNYLYWLLVSPLLKTFNDFLNLGGTTIIHLYQNVFERMPLVLPPIEEQKEIADYLDRKCNEIDRLIEIKGRKIEELKEYKKSLIYEYVTGKKEI